MNSLIGPLSPRTKAPDTCQCEVSCLCKKCAQCGVNKPLCRYYRDKKYLRNNCKACQDLHTVKYAKSEKGITTQKTRLARKEVKERRCQYERKRRVNSPERNLFLRVRRRCREENIEFTLNLEDIKIPSHCPVLGIELSHSLSKDHLPTVDRINPKGTYEVGNIVVMSMKANRIKNDATLEEIEKLLHFLVRLKNEQHS